MTSTPPLNRRFAEEALRQIAALYEIETAIRGQPAEERRRMRQHRSRPLIETMQGWLAETLGRISGRATLAQAIRYALNHWSGLILFLDDGRLELDTNTVERAMRPVALGRKNAFPRVKPKGMVRRFRQRREALGNHRHTDPVGEAERCRSAGLADRCT
jgi:hypothetical protein